MTIIYNFLKICHDYKQKRDDSTTSVVVNGSVAALPAEEERLTHGNNGASVPHTNMLQTRTTSTSTTRLQLSVRRVNAVKHAMPSNVFSALYANHSYAVWLDSSNAHIAVVTNNEETLSRFSILAAMDGPLSRRVEYFPSEDIVYDYDVRGNEIRHSMDILSFLRRDLQSMELQTDDYDLPFEYRGGYLGFLGYEVRHDTQRALQQLEHGQVAQRRQRQSFQTVSPTPSAAFLFADQSLVYDHWNQEWYLLGLSDENDDSSILEWMDRVQQVLLTMETSSLPKDVQEQRRRYHQPPLTFVPNRSPQRYRNNIETCHEQIRLGESYELCLTNQLETTVSQHYSPLQLYKFLRQGNPVPFAAFVNFQQGKSPLSICCSSPERFVSVKKQSPSSSHDDDTQQTSLHVEAKPIKGTCAREIVTGRSRTAMELQEDARRARELETCVKNRAENLMIVDLLRNDLNRVCQVDSVHVPKLMQIESYATVHQMVSTIRGVLQQDKNAIDVLQACFPGGSMTGAPKLRSMEILDQLEEGMPRGPYSGCLGYISLNGSMDMNIVIRSAVLIPKNDNEWHVSIGAGGAITALSESEDEYEEMLLKARAVVEAVQAWADCMPTVTEECTRFPAANLTLSNTV